MKRVEFGAFGTPHEVASCVESQHPGPPEAGEVLIEVEAFPINPADLLTITGGYAVRPALPATLGAEAVGRVVEVGSGVDSPAVGDRVISLARENWCQLRRLPASQVVKVPDGASPLQLAMLKVNPATALLMLRSYVDLQPGDWVIQDAANSGVGANLIRLAKADGIRTVNVVRRPGLEDQLEAQGADLVVVDADDLGDRVRAAIGGGNLRLAIDAVGGTLVMRLGDCLDEGGLIVNYGLLSGMPCQLGPYHLIFRGLTLTGFWLQKALTTMARPDVEALYADLGARIASGELAVEVEATYGIEDIETALEHAGREGRSGKILVTPNGPV